MEFVHPVFKLSHYTNYLFLANNNNLRLLRRFTILFSKGKPPPKFNYVLGTFGSSFSTNNDQKIGQPSKLLLVNLEVVKARNKKRRYDN
jgi:hypothetical protein